MIPPGRFQVLDAWRGICAILVAIFHFGPVPVLDIPLFSSAWIFVDFFFVLSGFVLCHRYFRSTPEFLPFVKARLLRLYPAHLLAGTVMLCLALSVAVIRFLLKGEIRVDGLGDSPAEIALTVASHALLVQGFVPFELTGLVVASWSLSIEFWVNVLFAALSRHFRLGVLTLACVTVVFVTGLASVDPLEYISGSLGANVLRGIVGFAAGGIAYRLSLIVPSPKWGANVSTFLELACLALMLGVCHLASRFVTLWVLPFAFAGVIFVFAMEGGAVSQRLLARPFQKMGACSYEIYLVHGIWTSLFVVVHTALERLAPGSLPELGALAPIARVGLYLTLVYISACSFHALLRAWVARPAHKPSEAVA